MSLHHSPTKTFTAPVENFPEIEQPVRIRLTDMDADEQTDAVRVAAKALHETSNALDIAKHVKRHFDARHRPYWHCVVGNGFATKHSQDGKFIFFDVGRQSIFLFQTMPGSEKAVDPELARTTPK